MHVVEMKHRKMGAGKTAQFVLVFISDWMKTWHRFFSNCAVMRHQLPVNSQGKTIVIKNKTKINGRLWVTMTMFFKGHIIISVFVTGCHRDYNHF